MDMNVTSWVEITSIETFFCLGHIQRSLKRRYNKFVSACNKKECVIQTLRNISLRHLLLFLTFCACSNPKHRLKLSSWISTSRLCEYLDKKGINYTESRLLTEGLMATTQWVHEGLACLPESWLYQKPLTNTRLVVPSTSTQSVTKTVKIDIRIPLYQSYTKNQIVKILADRTIENASHAKCEPCVIKLCGLRGQGGSMFIRWIHHRLFPEQHDPRKRIYLDLTLTDQPVYSKQIYHKLRSFIIQHHLYGETQTTAMKHNVGGMIVLRNAERGGSIMTKVFVPILEKGVFRDDVTNVEYKCSHFLFVVVVDPPSRLLFTDPTLRMNTALLQEEIQQVNQHFSIITKTKLVDVWQKPTNSFLPIVALDREMVLYFCHEILKDITAFVARTVQIQICFSMRSMACLSLFWCQEEGMQSLLSYQNSMLTLFMDYEWGSVPKNTKIGVRIGVQNKSSSYQSDKAIYIVINNPQTKKEKLFMHKMNGMRKRVDVVDRQERYKEEELYEFMRICAEQFGRLFSVSRNTFWSGLPIVRTHQPLIQLKDYMYRVLFRMLKDMKRYEWHGVPVLSCYHSANYRMALYQPTDLTTPIMTVSMA